MVCYCIIVEIINNKVKETETLKSTISKLEEELSLSQAAVFKLKATLKDTDKELSELKLTNIAHQNSLKSEALEKEVYFNLILDGSFETIKKRIKRL